MAKIPHTYTIKVLRARTQALEEQAAVIEAQNAALYRALIMHARGGRPRGNKGTHADHELTNVPTKGSSQEADGMDLPWWRRNVTLLD